MHSTPNPAIMRAWLIYAFIGLFIQVGGCGNQQQIEYNDANDYVASAIAIGKAATATVNNAYVDGVITRTQHREAIEELRRGYEQVNQARELYRLGRFSEADSQLSAATLILTAVRNSLATYGPTHE